MKQIGILGAGTWGITLARLLSLKGANVTVWSKISQEINDLTSTKQHKNLPQMKIPDSITFTTNIADACCDKDIVLFATPSIYIRSTVKEAKPYLSANAILVSVAKGLEPDTLFTMTQVIEAEIGSSQKIVALSGPTHAEEVACDQPTMIVSASTDIQAAKEIQSVFSTDFMRVYTNTDVLGVELCGALKNIIALASGIAAGLGYGDNAKAALITRGIAEISRLGGAMGANPLTFSGLAGIGDLVVTATSMHSRNNRAGILIGKGATAKEATEQIGMVVEGLNALNGALALSHAYGIEMPITQAVDAVVNHGKKPEDAVNELMGRKRKHEYE